jgi:glutamate racemase
VGIFDSGVGGLSVLREIRTELPGEDILYIADSANAPWGDKPLSFVGKRGLALARFLIEQGAKAIVIGSNTGTAGSAEVVRAKVAVPVVGIEPAVKPAAAATRTGVVGAIVPAALGGSSRFAGLIDRFGKDINVIAIPAPGLVERIEAGDLTGSQTRMLVERYTRPMLDAGADAIILGSTHYVFLRPLIQDVVGRDVTLIDTGQAVARQLRRVLERDALLNEDRHAPTERFWTSGDPRESTRVVSMLLGRQVTVEALPAPVS